MNYSIEELALLKQTVDATLINSSIYSVPGNMHNLAQAGLVEANLAMVDPATGGYAYRATAAGIAFSQQGEAVQATAPQAPAGFAPVAAPVQGFSSFPVVDTPAPVPTLVAPVPGAPAAVFSGTGFKVSGKTIRRASGAARDYKFEELEIGGFVFVPATPERPNPKKSVASTVSTANKRYKDFSPRRYFVTERATAGQVFCDGAIIAPSDGVFIVRVEPPLDA
jgi:hypothetical protein